MPARMLLVAAAALVVVAGAMPRAQRADGGIDDARGLRGLNPGAFVVHEQAVPVEIVLLGFGERQIDTQDLLEELPSAYAPAARYPRFYGLKGRELGLRYRFQYSVTRRSQSFEERFFEHLAAIGREGPATPYQDAYNGQRKRVLDVAGPILYIDAPRVEHWLAEHDRRGDRGYRVYFINWFSRTDFRFHVYTKTDEPDPDTSFNFGALAQTALNSWGGSERHSWFYDLSAGPEWNTSNWVVDVEDLDGNGTPDHRMPPIWEYAAGGYRAPHLLDTDLGLLTRYVAINLLFTPSPLYDPMVAAPGPRGRKVTDITMLEDDPLTTGADFIDPQFARQSWRGLAPYYQWATELRSVSPIDAGARIAQETFTLTRLTPGCWRLFASPFAQMYCHFTENRDTYIPAYRDVDSVNPVFSFNTTSRNLGAQLGLLGFADDNWVDGTQSVVVAFGSQDYRDAGYGFTGTIIHEVGHHSGLPHPHDGYDAETGEDYGPDVDKYFFAWAGDESDTVMHYLGLTSQFSEHDKDNLHRWEMAGYLNWSNALVADILASPNAWRVRHGVVVADRLAAQALSSFEDWRYLAAVTAARGAYVALVEAADEIGVSSARLDAARQRLPQALIQRYVCRPRYLEERLATR